MRTFRILGSLFLLVVCLWACALVAVVVYGRRDEARAADAVRPLLVFLDLLEGDAAGLRQIGLAHLEQDATGADAVADMDVDGVVCLAHGEFLQSGRIC